VSTSILDSYVTGPPSDQNALDIFSGEWASRFPAEFSSLRAGTIPLFEDPRVSWALQELGSIEGQNVLELGPLEGGHSFMLERAGAQSIISIEANTRAFLKCLISKEILRLSKVRFQCGNFVSFLQANNTRYDLVFAAGVLYHMSDPANLIALLAACTDRVYFWTHYYDHDIISQTAHLRGNFSKESHRSVLGFEHKLYRQEYGAALQTKQFCGGAQSFSNWMTREDLLLCLKHFGYQDLRIAHEQRDHPHGPCFSVLAQKQSF
jgi:hypothetical protein